MRSTSARAARLSTFGGAPLSLDALVRGELPFIRRRLRALFPPQLDLDDLEQHVLLNVHRNLHSYRGEGSLRAWLDRITVRVGFKHARQIRAREQREQPLSDDLNEGSPGSLSETYFTRRWVGQLLSGLSPAQRHAVVLHHVLGFEVAEIASDQGVPTETARSRLRVGMRKLRSRARLRSESFTHTEASEVAQRSGSTNKRNANMPATGGGRYVGPTPSTVNSLGLYGTSAVADSSQPTERDRAETASSTGNAKNGSVCSGSLSVKPRATAVSAPISAPEHRSKRAASRRDSA
jgi:RNA polymerase sigma-70 factor, ECF subfamily